MGDLITNAQAGFASTTGFSMDSVVTWAGDNLIKLWLGSGFALLYSLRYWIAALIVVTAIVFFSYRAYAAYRH
jgi:hypothetical protein